jgi:hypothetical protein
MAFDQTRADGRAARVEVARGMLAHGFLDRPLRLFLENAAHVRAEDWSLISERLIAEGRLDDAVYVCRTGGIELPRAEVLARGDQELRRRDIDGAIHHYELADASRERWEALLDVLIGLPNRELTARAIARKHLVDERRTAVALPLAASA